MLRAAKGALLLTDRAFPVRMCAPALLDRITVVTINRSGPEKQQVISSAIHVDSDQGNWRGWFPFL
jgi:hypothetical protein